MVSSQYLSDLVFFFRNYVIDRISVYGQTKLRMKFCRLFTNFFTYNFPVSADEKLIHLLAFFNLLFFKSPPRKEVNP